MKSALTILLITCFAGVAVFGFIGMRNMDEVVNSGCLAALMQNGICPSASNAPLAAAFLHLDILRSFSTALLTNVLLLLALAASVLFGLKNYLVAQSALGIRKLFFYAQRSTSIGNDFFSSNLSWLNIHLNSPAPAMSA